MKSEFKAKFLQHVLSKQKEDKGFTLIELLVVIIIIGILSAIALPSFLNQANKAKQSEAKQNTGSMNRAQQAYVLENSDFATTVPLLGLGIPTQTINYSYGVSAPGAKVNNAFTAMLNYAASLKNPLRHYAGRVWLGTVVETSESTSLAILCETIKPVAATAPSPDTNQPTSTASCAAEWKLLEAK